MKNQSIGIGVGMKKVLTLVLKAEWAKTTKLNVKRNDTMTWDFTENKEINLVK